MPKNKEQDVNYTNNLKDFVRFLRNLVSDIIAVIVFLLFLAFCGRCVDEHNFLFLWIQLKKVNQIPIIVHFCQESARPSIPKLDLILSNIIWWLIVSAGRLERRKVGGCCNVGANSGQNESFEQFWYGRKIGDRLIFVRRACVETCLFKGGTTT